MLRAFMKKLFSVALLFIAFVGSVRAGSETASRLLTEDLDAPRFEISTESAYLMGIIGNPNSYEIGAQFPQRRESGGARCTATGGCAGSIKSISSRWREPIFRGPENPYFRRSP